jgi:hypothetical protein
MQAKTCLSTHPRGPRARHAAVAGADDIGFQVPLLQDPSASGTSLWDTADGVLDISIAALRRRYPEDMMGA